MAETNFWQKVPDDSVCIWVIKITLLCTFSEINVFYTEIQDGQNDSYLTPFLRY